MKNKLKRRISGVLAFLICFTTLFSMGVTLYMQQRKHRKATWFPILEMEIAVQIEERVLGGIHQNP